MNKLLTVARRNRRIAPLYRTARDEDGNSIYSVLPAARLLKSVVVPFESEALGK